MRMEDFQCDVTIFFQIAGMKHRRDAAATNALKKLISTINYLVQYGYPPFA